MLGSVFAKNLRKYREQMGLTQVALGDRCGYAQGHISNLERGVIAPSMAVLERLASALGIPPAELLIAEVEDAPGGAVVEGIPIINARSRDRLPAPTIADGKASADSNKLLCVPGLNVAEAFAAYLPDNAMAPPSGKGDLVVFSLKCESADGDACLVDAGKKGVLFRTVLALPGGGWRLQPNNPRYEPIVLKARRGVRMWPAIGRWQMLPPRPRR